MDRFKQLLVDSGLNFNNSSLLRAVKKDPQVQSGVSEFKALSHEDAIREKLSLMDLQEELKKGGSSEKFEEVLSNTSKNFHRQYEEVSGKWDALRNKTLSDKDIDLNALDYKNLSDRDIKNIQSVIKDNPTDIINTVKENKILGEFGEKTLNQLLNDCFGMFAHIEKIGIDSQVAGVVFSGGSAVFLYRSVVKMYVKHAFKYSQTSSVLKNQGAEMRAREIRFFMLWAAPVITCALLVGRYGLPLKWSLNIGVDINSSSSDMSTTTQSISSNQDISVNQESTLKSDGAGNQDSGAVVGGGLMGGIGFFSSVKNIVPKWLRQLIYLVFYIVFINYFLTLVEKNTTFDIKLLFYEYSFLIKLFFMVGAFFSVLIVLLNILNYYLFIKFSKDQKDEIKFSPYLPQFILNWLNQIKKISKVEDKDKSFFLGFYFRPMFVFSINFLLCLGMIKFLTYLYG